MSYITTHVLDATAGRPAAGVAVTLRAVPTDEQIASGVTDDDGRIADLGPDRLEPGHYRIDFGTGDNPYKRDWMEEVRLRYRLDMLRPLAPQNWLIFAKSGLRRLAGKRKHG